MCSDKLCCAFLMLMGAVAIAQNTPAPAAAAHPTSINNALSLYAGEWTSKSQMYDTDFSKAQEITAKLTCSWTADSQFLICDQTITDASGRHSQLTVYSYNLEQNAYFYSTFSGPGAPTGGKLEVGDHRFIYAGSSEQGGKRTMFRTTNTFSPSGDRYIFVAEFSTDDGAHWTRMLEGTTARLQR